MKWWKMIKHDEFYKNIVKLLKVRKIMEVQFSKYWIKIENLYAEKVHEMLENGMEYIIILFKRT